VPQGELDAAGNDIARLEAFLPNMRAAAEKLCAPRLGNQQPHIHAAASAYLAQLQGTVHDIDFNLLFIHGLTLEEATRAAARDVTGLMGPSLENDDFSALNTLVGLHGPFLLGSAVGRALIDDSERYKSDQALAHDIHAALETLRDSLTPDIAAPEVPEVIDLSLSTTSETHPERPAVFLARSAINLTIVLVAGAAVASFPIIGAATGAVIGAASGGFIGAASGGLIGGSVGRVLEQLVGEALKESEGYKRLRRQISEDFNRLSEADLDEFQALARKFHPFREFVLCHDEALRRIAGNQPSMLWVHTYLDWLKNPGPPAD